MKQRLVQFYLFVDGSSNRSAYQIMPNGQLWKFPPGEYDVKPGVAPVTAEEIERLVGKPSESAIWKRCDKLYESAKFRWSASFIEPGKQVKLEHLLKEVHAQIRE